jgi:uncharacterized protein (TIGR01777 family)
MERAPVQRYLARSPMPVPEPELRQWHARPGVSERLRPPFQTLDLTRLEHTRRTLPESEDRSILEDEVADSRSGGGMGLAGALIPRLESLFAYRHAVTAADLARHQELAGPPLRVGITGSHGFIGTSLTHFLQAGGHTVVRLGRSGGFDSIDGLDAVVNLAGAGIADGRWTAARKRELRESRLQTTTALAEAIARARRPPLVWVSGSAIGFYGDRGEKIVDESTGRGVGFLSELSEAWEGATRPAQQVAVRVVLLRTGIVLSPEGGALGKMLFPFRMGLGGRIGSGRQGFSWVALEDVIGAIHFALLTPSLRGPINLTAPEPVSNARFTAALGRVLKRPVVATLPATGVRLLFGEMGQESLLAGAHVFPRALLDARFRFRWPSLEQALRFCLGEDRLRSAV